MSHLKVSAGCVTVSGRRFLLVKSLQISVTFELTFPVVAIITKFYFCIKIFLICSLDCARSIPPSNIFITI